ncbi:DUF2130 domain-containing protein [Candidatus Gottesmanbacteria bacterium]|nr:DUF2130 domain-containing protein [Candidatus Gottesmanbacteria bacterium]
MNSIRCPHCGKTVEISEAFRHEVEEKIRLSEREKFKEELEKAKKELETEFAKELQEKTSMEITDLKKQVEEKEKRLSEHREQEIKLREEKRKVEEKEKELSLTIVRRVDEERKKVEEAVAKQVFEQYRLKEQEKEKIIHDLKVALEDARRKAESSSQQLQGEVQELDLEMTLKQAFPHDIIESVEKGERGADLRQIVKTPLGNICGVILWESKRTKGWQDGWIAKLKEDLRRSKAHISIIVTAVTPKDITSGMGYKEGVYICTHTFALTLAEILRKNLFDVAREKFIVQNREGKAVEVYEYVNGHEFRQHVEEMIEIYSDMKKQIEKERVAYEKIWKMRETQIARLTRGTAQVAGNLQGLIGPSFSQIKGLDLNELESGDKNSPTKDTTKV